LARGGKRAGSERNDRLRRQQRTQLKSESVAVRWADGRKGGEQENGKTAERISRANGLLDVKFVDSRKSTRPLRNGMRAFVDDEFRGFVDAERVNDIGAMDTEKVLKLKLVGGDFAVGRDWPAHNVLEETRVRAG